jgi:hypothetical protein
MNRTKIIVFAAVSLLVFGFAAFTEGRRRPAKRKVTEKSEVPAHTETVDRGVLPSESRHVDTAYFLVVSSGGMTEKMPVSRDVYENAVIGEEITLTGK